MNVTDVARKPAAPKMCWSTSFRVVIALLSDAVFIASLPFVRGRLWGPTKADAMSPEQASMIEEVYFMIVFSMRAEGKEQKKEIWSAKSRAKSLYVSRNKNFTGIDCVSCRTRVQTLMTGMNTFVKIYVPWN
jgi:hypothetical protein